MTTLVEILRDAAALLAQAQERLAQVLAQLGATRAQHAGTAPVADVVALGSNDLATRETSRFAYPQDFLEFWNTYPLKRDKRKALLAWRKAVVRADASAICAGAKRYADDPNRVAQFTKYAEGWLNADAWEDAPLPPRDSGRPPGPMERAHVLAARLEET